MTLGADLIFNRCPLCTSTRQGKRVPSLAKDLSKPGYSYVRCANCESWYLADLRKTDISGYYAESTAYESVSSKAAAANELADLIGLTGSERVLDLGGGSGAWALPMLSRCAMLTATDVSAGGLEMLRRSAETAAPGRINTVVAESLEFLRTSPSEAFDVILSMFSLEHDCNPRALLLEARRCLAPGGRMVVLVPSADALQLAVLGKGYYWFQAPWHTLIPSRAGLLAASGAAGFGACAPFRLQSLPFSWFWVRGFADRWGLRRVYNRCRASPAFVRSDIGCDKLFDRLATAIGRPSCCFYLLES